MVERVTTSTAALLDAPPRWATLLRAPNPGPMTLDGTNTWVLRGPGSAHAVVVDPGPLDAGHLAAVAAHGPFAGILVTHGHLDHTEGVPELSRLTGADVVHLDGELILAGIRVRAIDTPGHTRDSVCYVVNDEAVLTGDTILGRGTTVVAWPDGDLSDYLRTLRGLAELGPLAVLPGHGPALADCAGAARYYLHHREARLEQVRGALASGIAEAAEVVRVVYGDLDSSLWPAAELSVRAQLAYLKDHP
jgi:glyoxylase-like metal-dependent hydrolase (beta-lactamase superfamily II)